MRPVNKLPQDERLESLVTLRQSVAQLVLKALRLGASSADILESVGRGIDHAAEVHQTRVEIAPVVVRRGLRLVQWTGRIFLLFLFFPALLHAQTPPTQSLQVVYNISDLQRIIDVFSADSNGVLTPVAYTIPLASKQIPIFGYASISANQNVLFVGTLENYIASFQIQATGNLTEEANSPAASGLQDLAGMAATSDGKYLFVGGNNLQDENLGEIAIFQIGDFGTLTAINTVQLDNPFPEAMSISANGQFLYVFSGQNGTASLQAFSVSNGVLTELHLAIADEANAQALACNALFCFGSYGETGTIDTFNIQADGSLVFASTALTPGIVNRMAIDSTGAFLYTNLGSFEISSSGSLTLLQAAPANTLFAPITTSTTSPFLFEGVQAAASPFNLYSENVNGSGTLTQISVVPTSGFPTFLVLATIPNGTQPPPVQYTLQINLEGSGSGTVTTQPTGTSFASSTPITLTAMAAAGSQFVGWNDSIGCLTNVCGFLMPASNVNIQAVFTAISPAISVTPTTQSGSAGASFSYQITAANFSSTPKVAATCAIPKGACTISGMVLTVTTSAPSTSVLFPLQKYPWAAVGLLIFVAWIVLPKKRRLVLAFGALIAMSACGSASSERVPVSTSTPGTPQGTYSLTIQATNGANQSANVNASLIIQ